jgi:hypothetical protein
MEESLFRVSRINGGWIVREEGRGIGPGKTCFAGTWDEAAALMRKIAFPYPNDADPRGPAD